MEGPRPRGFWTRHFPNGGAPHRFLVPGRRYEVLRAFTDYDGGTHAAGETWTFLGHSFVPYHDGMSFFVSLDGEREWLVRLQWLPEAQGGVLDALDEHLREI